MPDFVGILARVHQLIAARSLQKVCFNGLASPLEHGAVVLAESFTHRLDTNVGIHGVWLSYERSRSFKGRRLWQSPACILRNPELIALLNIGRDRKQKPTEERDHLMPTRGDHGQSHEHVPYEQPRDESLKAPIVGHG